MPPFLRYFLRPLRGLVFLSLPPAPPRPFGALFALRPEPFDVFREKSFPRAGAPGRIRQCFP